MRIGVDQDVLARMVVRHVTAHHQASATAARRLAEAAPRAVDDAAGVAIATRMQAREAGAAAASRGVQDGISLMQVADGALAAMTDYLDKVRVISVQASNDAFGPDQRHGLQVGIDTLLDGFDDTWRSLSDGMRTIQVGPDAGETMNLPATATGERRWGVSVLDADSARSALDVLDEAVDELLVQRAAVGAAENRLSRILNTLAVQGDSAREVAARRTQVDLGTEVRQLLESRTWAQAGAAMVAEVQQAGRRAVEILLASAIEPVPVPDATAPEAEISPDGGVRTVPGTAPAAAPMTGPVGHIDAGQSALLMGHFASSALPHVVPVTASVPMSASASSTQPEPNPPTDLSSAVVGGADRAVT